MSSGGLKSFRRRYDRSDTDIETLCNKMKKGIIDLNPDFQRHYVWPNDKASLLIESILLNIPIPNIYLAEKDDSNLEVIDGIQRLTSIYKFMNNELTLKNLKTATELNGKKYKDLDIYQQNWINRFTLSIVTFDNDCDPNMKFEIFLRYNQGSIKLNDQELRNCLFKGYLNDQIKILRNDSFIKSFFNESNKEKDRMEVEELILRGLARINYEKMASKTNLSVAKSNNLSKQLNYFMATFRNDKKVVDDMIQEYLNLLNLMKDVLGVEIFQKSKNGTYRFRYDVILMAFKDMDKEELLNNKDSIRSYVYESIGQLDVERGNSAKQSAVENKIEIIQDAVQEGILNYI
jgi:hypothetical protein